MNNTFLSLLISAWVTAVTAAANVNADNYRHNEFSNFKPLTESANNADWDIKAPWKLPEGFSQLVVSDETSLNIYDGGRDDWHDMNVVNESGENPGRYLYRTHELRSPGNQPQGGSVSVVDLNTGKTMLLTQDPDYDALDGIRWTPWGTLLFAEEKTHGRLFEIELIKKNNNRFMQTYAVYDRPAVGRIAHEGIDLDTQGNVYVVDEYRGRTSNECEDKPNCGGGVYKFVPDSYADLSSGNLYVLGIISGNRDNTGQGAWLGPIDPLTARKSGTAAGGASYQRPEDLEIINGVLYVAITEGPRDEYGNEYYEGRVISVDLNTMKISNFVKPGVNAPVELGKPGEEGHQTGFDSVDNLAEAPNGDLVMIEDNSPSDIWFASTSSVNDYGASEKVRLFASLTDPQAEGTGIYFSPTEPNTLFVNIQHSAAADGDGTWAITTNRVIK